MAFLNYLLSGYCGFTFWCRPNSKVSGELGKSIHAFKEGLGNKSDENTEDKSESSDSTKNT